MIGSIIKYKTKDGDERWRFQAPPREDPLTGKLVRPGSGGHLSYEAAYAEKIRYNASIGLLTVDTAASLRDVLQLRMVETVTTPSTQAGYASKMNTLPEWILSKPIVEIDKGHIETMLREIMERRVKLGGEPYTLSYMNTLLSLVSGSFQYAIQKRVPIGNPCANVLPRKVLAPYFQTKAGTWKASRRKDANKDTWQTATVQRAVGQGPVIPKSALADFITEMPYPYAGYYATTFLQALRRGESLGMSWDRTDVDPDYAAALIQETITLISGKVYITPVPKNGQPRESLLDDLTLRYLTEQREEQDHQKEIYGDWKDNWVFTSIKQPASRGWYPGIYLRPFTVLDKFKLWMSSRRIDNDGIRTLRRTWANIAANELGIPPYVIMKVLGHTGETVTTEHYTVATDEQAREALAAVRELVFPDALRA